MLEAASDHDVDQRRRIADEAIDVVVRTTCEPARRTSLQRAIASVVGQRGVTARALVVVAGARARPLPELPHCAGLRVHRVGEDASPGRALMIARRLIDAPFFAFLDDDDELLPDALATRLAILRAEPRVDVVVTTGWLCDGKDRRLHIADIARHQEDPLHGIIERCWLPSCGGLFRTTAVRDDVFAELPDLCEWTCVAFRLALAATTIRFVDRPTYVVHDSAGSMAKSDAFVEATLRVLAAMRAVPLPTRQRRRLARKYGAALHAAAEQCRRAGEMGKAWRYHLCSLQPPDTLRYAAYTRKLVWKSRLPAADADAFAARDTAAPPAIAVVVCTRNRARALARCLHHLADALRACEHPAEVVVVDNGSSDDTREVVLEHAASWPIRYVHEARPGLSRARNRGIAATRGAIVAFTDDDCEVDPDWMQAIVAAFASRPELAILGGMVAPARDGAHPVSLRMHVAAKDIASADAILATMSGCNMAFRRDVFERIGLFDPAFGKGRRIGSAEDLDLMYRALRRGSAMLYLPHVVVRHAHGRDSAAAVDRVNREYVKGRGAFYCKFIADREIARMAYWEVSGLLARRRSGAGTWADLGSLAAGAALQSLTVVRGGMRR